MCVSVVVYRTGCPRSGLLCGRTFFTNIFMKTKNFTKLFLGAHMGRRLNLLSKKYGKKSRDTVPLIASQTTGSLQTFVSRQDIRNFR